jgi:hypothetical protein
VTTVKSRCRLSSGNELNKTEKTRLRGKGALVEGVRHSTYIAAGSSEKPTPDRLETQTTDTPPRPSFLAAFDEIRRRLQGSVDLFRQAVACSFPGALAIQLRAVDVDPLADIGMMIKSEDGRAFCLIQLRRTLPDLV